MNFINKIIVANWKCNPTSQKDALRLFGAIKKTLLRVLLRQRLRTDTVKLRKGRGVKKTSAEVVICPPFVYLPLLKGLTLGAQNVSGQESGKSGAFTGAISVLQLKDLKVEYVILGHSESRKYFAETNQIINKKIKKCLNAGLKVIFCIGENDGESKNKVLENQLTEGLKDISEKYLKDIIIAYEPVWAIGTGKNCSIEETKNSVSIIKNVISKLYPQVSSDTIKVLYGGSVNSQNSGDYIKQANVGGLLVGGASLKSEEFIKIVLSASI